MLNTIKVTITNDVDYSASAELLDASIEENDVRTLLSLHIMLFPSWTMRGNGNTFRVQDGEMVEYNSLFAKAYKIADNGIEMRRIRSDKIERYLVAKQDDYDVITGKEFTLYMKDGIVTREDGPAYETDRIKAWLKNGKYHRDGEAAVSHKDRLEWYTDGELMKTVYLKATTSQIAKAVETLEAAKQTLADAKVKYKGSSKDVHKKMLKRYEYELSMATQHHADLTAATTVIDDRAERETPKERYKHIKQARDQARTTTSTQKDAK